MSLRDLGSKLPGSAHHAALKKLQSVTFLRTQVSQEIAGNALALDLTGHRSVMLVDFPAETKAPPDARGPVDLAIVAASESC